MRLTILAIGTRGDVQPFLALGVGLEQAGYDVCIATHPRFEPAVQRVGLRFAPLAEGRLSEGSATREGRRWMKTGSRWLPSAVGFLMDARSVAKRRLADAMHACEGSDVIVASDFATLIGWQVAEYLQVTLVRGLLNPEAMPAVAFGGPIVRAIRQTVWFSLRPPLGSIRRAVGLPPPPIGEPIAAMERQRTPVLYAWSPAVAPPPARAGQQARVTGYWFLDENIDAEPPPALLEFLAAGPAPVCIAFGSMLPNYRARSMELAIAALGRAGQRGVLICDRHELRGIDVPAHVFPVDPIEHRWLFPRCSAVVHHAGAGTAAATVRAGVPSIPVPFMRFQHPLAEQIHQLGVATEPIPCRRLTVERCYSAIVAATSDEEMRSRASTLAERVRAEDGVAQAVAVIEDTLNRLAVPSRSSVVIPGEGSGTTHREGEAQR